MPSEFTITAPRVISMKDSQHHDERWLHSLLKDDPSLLGLGDLVFRDSERPQPSGGRLDLLLSDPETSPPTRYEVEIQLGATDESHIIRTIEYWDIERKRYPQYAHIAVIVAEQVTSRFLNVIQLFNGTIPLIAIQLQLVEVNGSHTLIPSRIVDLFQRGTDEEDEGPLADRSYWESKASSGTLQIIDDMIARANTLLSPGKPYEAKYNLHYIGIMQDGKTKNFMTFNPRKQHTIAEFKTDLDEQVGEAAEAGIDLVPPTKWLPPNKWSGSRIRLVPGDLEKFGEHIDDLIRRAHEQYR